MRVQIQKWGNSLALRIPKAFAVESNIEEGSTVLVTLEQKGILMKAEKNELTLENLIGGITNDNIHDEIDFGGPKGNEVW